uniref:Uncharacterized protein n=1 Tax=Plectus sambesii TaxID=2011161 RepID=A0A914UW00_9BILA
MKEKLIADYLVCLSQKPGFPPAVAHLNKDPTVKKQLSTTFDETLETMDDNVEEVVKNPCESPLFPSVEWDTVAFFNVETKHTTICQRTPKVTKMEAQQKSGRVKRRQPETPQEKGIKKDICSGMGLLPYSLDFRFCGIRAVIK